MYKNSVCFSAPSHFWLVPPRFGCSGDGTGPGAKWTHNAQDEGRLKNDILAFPATFPVCFISKALLGPCPPGISARNTDNLSIIFSVETYVFHSGRKCLRFASKICDKFYGIFLGCSTFISSALQKFRNENYWNFCWNILVSIRAPPRNFARISNNFLCGILQIGRFGKWSVETRPNISMFCVSHLLGSRT